MKSNCKEFIKIFLNESKSGNLDGMSLNEIILYNGNDENLCFLKVLLKLFKERQLKTLLELEKGDVLIEYLEILYEFVSKREKDGIKQDDIAVMFDCPSTTIKRIENLDNVTSSLNFLRMQKFIQKK